MRFTTRPKEVDTNGPWNSTRLPDYIRPSFYFLRLQPNLEAGNFSGRVLINIDVSKKTNYILVHAFRLGITKTILRAAVAGQKKFLRLKVHRTFYYPPNDYFVIQIHKETENMEILPGRYQLKLHFDGQLRTDAVGFYRASYKTPKGEKRYLAASNFEPTYARRAFPCFDEPEMKAKYVTTLVAPKGYVSLSNMPVAKKSKEKKTGQVTSRFFTSPPMPTYLAAFIVCDFYHSRVKTSRGTLIRVWAPKHKVIATKYALKTTKRVLEYLEGLLKIPYQLPKVDLIGLPEYKAGTAAMENWGLITFSEKSLFFHPKHSATRAKQGVTSVITHELVHQWFGNLVTLKWWNDLWLNEGITRYVEQYTVRQLYPEFHLNETFVIGSARAKYVDSFPGAHPVHLEVSGCLPSIRLMFSKISYEKGAAMVRMLHDMYGDHLFFTALRHYLSKYKLGNAEEVNFWDSLDHTFSQFGVKGPALRDRMRSWTRQSGFPQLLVGDTANAAGLSQVQFRFARTHFDDYSLTWNLPISFVTMENSISKQHMWFDGNNSAAIFPFAAHRPYPAVVSNSTDPSDSDEVPDDHLLIANIGQTGFYRVNYSPAHWSFLSRLLLKNHNKISSVDRAGLLDDAFSLARVGELDYSYVFNLTKYLVNERDYAPWLVAVHGFGYIRSRLANFRLRIDFDDFVRELLQPMVNVFGPLGKKHNTTTPDRHDQKLLKSLILQAAVSYNHTTVREQALQLFETFKKHSDNYPHYIANDVLAIVLKVGIQEGTEADWSFLWNQLASPKVISAHRQPMLQALAAARSTKLLRRLIINTFRAKPLKRQERLQAILGVVRNDLGPYLIWNMYKKNYKKKALRRMPVWRVIGATVAHFNTPRMRDEVEDFFEKAKKKRFIRRKVMRAALEKLTGNMNWRRNSLFSVCLALAHNKGLAKGKRSSSRCFAYRRHRGFLEVLHEVPRPANTTGLSYHNKHLFTATKSKYGLGSIVKIDAYTGRVVETTPLPRGVDVITSTEDNIWMLNYYNGKLLNGTFFNDAIEYSLAGKISVKHPYAASPSEGDQLWVVGEDGSRIVEVNRHNAMTGRVVTTQFSAISAVAWDGRGVWASTLRSHRSQVFWIDPGTGEVPLPYDLPFLLSNRCPVIDSMAFTGRGLWVTGSECDKMYFLDVPRLTPSH